MRRVRDGDERDSIYIKYFTRIGHLVRGTIKDHYGTGFLVNLEDGVEAILPRSQQSAVERLIKHERIRAVITKVTKDANFSQEVVELSRRSSVFLQRLFEQEVDEILNGNVVIKAAGREAGKCGKIAVISTDPQVDPIAACLGPKDAHVRAINRELRGEKIDVIEWSDEPIVLAVRALAPAKISEVRVIDTEERVMDAIVSEDQMELAAGKQGENLRAASELVGWRINLTPENEPSAKTHYQ